MKNKLTQEEIYRYSRHLMIPQVGLSGQEKLKESSVLIVGTGGLGSPISLYLAAAGIGKIGLVDFDTVDSSNLQRQIVHSTSNVGKPKVESAKERLQDLNPYINIEIFNQYLSSDTIEAIASGYEIIVDGTDNFSSRYLLNDYCVLYKKIYVYGSIYRFEGQVSVFDAEHGPCYRCIFPTPPAPGLVPTCGEGGVFGILPGTIGTLQATQVIKMILNIGEKESGNLYLYDALDLSLQKIKLRKNPKCKICGDQPEIKNLEETKQFCAVHEQTEQPIPTEWEISPERLNSRINSGQKTRLIDVRDPVEQEISKLPNSELIPFERIHLDFESKDPDELVVFYCRNGIRSERAVRQLRLKGFENVLNLKGGTNAWVQKYDKNKFIY